MVAIGFILQAMGTAFAGTPVKGLEQSEVPICAPMPISLVTRPLKGSVVPMQKIGVRLEPSDVEALDRLTATLRCHRSSLVRALLRQGMTAMEQKEATS
jgi:hypothetical protein